VSRFELDPLNLDYKPALKQLMGGAARNIAQVTRHPEDTVGDGSSQSDDRTRR
jgi:hypothetical protein